MDQIYKEIKSFSLENWHFQILFIMNLHFSSGVFNMKNYVDVCVCFFTMLASFVNVAVILFYTHTHTHTQLLDLCFIQSSSTTLGIQSVRWQIKLLFIDFDNKWKIDIMNYFWKNTQWTEDMLHFGKATEYKTEIGLMWPPKIKSSDSACFEKKNVEVLFSPQRLIIHLCYSYKS